MRQALKMMKRLVRTKIEKPGRTEQQFFKGTVSSDGSVAVLSPTLSVKTINFSRNQINKL